MRGHKRLSRTGNKVMREQVGMVPVQVNVWEARLRWFVQIERSVNAPPRRFERIFILRGRVEGKIKDQRWTRMRLAN